MSKLLRCSIASSSSEVAKQRCLDAIGVTEDSSNVEIIRDSNGKVVEVRITIPDGASDAAETALLGTPGVSTSSGSEPPGGGDGKIVESLDGSVLLSDAGWDIDAVTNGSSITTDGDIITFGIGAIVRYQKDRLLGSRGTKNILKIRMKKDRIAGPHTANYHALWEMKFDKAHWIVLVEVGNDGAHLWLARLGNPDVIVVDTAYDGTVFHDFEFSTDGTTAELKLDGVVKASANFSTGFTAAGNQVSLEFAATDNAMQVDTITVNQL